MPPETFAIRSPDIRLDDLLKAAGLVASGGEAKVRIQGREVHVNGAVEIRRSHRIPLGSTVRLGSRTVRVVAA